MKVLTPRAHELPVGRNFVFGHEEEGFGKMKDALHSKTELSDRGRLRGLLVQGKTENGFVIRFVKATVVDDHQARATQQRMGTPQYAGHHSKTDFLSPSVVGVLEQLFDDR